MKYQILQGDNRDTLKTLADNSIDAIVTDPPYGIDFLGKDWDANTGALETYQECLRVLKPGGHILAFSAARTYHHLAITLEQAGFEIRDQIMWIYSSGFPKSQDVGRSIQRNQKNKDPNEWLGWGTQLKPAHEPICLARKPIKLSIARNCQVHGVGALNIDATRIPADDLPGPGHYSNKSATGGFNGSVWNNDNPDGQVDADSILKSQELGRFPSNVLGEIEGYQKYFYCPKVGRRERNIGCIDPGPQFQVPSGFDYRMPSSNNANNGESQVSIVEKNANNGSNNHPTVKPIELMKYLIRLITPPGGTVLDPFTGSGSTGCAAVELGYEYIGCELNERYVEIARRRIEAWYAHIHPLQATGLFE